MHKKKLLAIHLNEFNLNFLKYGAKKFNCQNIKKILKFNKVKTISVDKIQDKNLDPWVQTVSINSGRTSSNHKIFKTGQIIPKNLIQIWDILAKKNISCGVWGTMNTRYNKNKNLKIFFPDPWNEQVQTKPSELKYLYKLPRSYAKTYTDFKIKNNFSFIFQFIYSIFQTKLYKYIFYKIFFYLNIFIKIRLNNFFLFFLFDIFSLDIFLNLCRKNNVKFSLIFLNSLAHFQHNNWDEKKNYEFFFKLTDEMLRIVLKNMDTYDQLVIFNGFKQKKIKPEFILRPKNPNKFLKSLGFNFKRFNPNMTNGGILEFQNFDDKVRCIKILSSKFLFGYKVFEIKELNKNKLFIRIQIKTFTKINYNKNKQFIIKNIDYDGIKLKRFNKNSFDYKNFFRDMVFIKTTGKHIPNGELLYKKNINKKKTIQNQEIFKILKEYFA